VANNPFRIIGEDKDYSEGEDHIDYAKEFKTLNELLDFIVSEGSEGRQYTLTKHTGFPPVLAQIDATS